MFGIHKFKNNLSHTLANFIIRNDKIEWNNAIAEIPKYLIEYGGLLCIASYVKHMDFVMAILSIEPKCVNFKTSKGGRTALYYALQNFDEDIVEYLLDCCAECDMTDRDDDYFYYYQSNIQEKLRTMKNNQHKQKIHHKYNYLHGLLSKKITINDAFDELEPSVEVYEKLLEDAVSFGYFDNFKYLMELDLFIDCSLSCDQLLNKAMDVNQIDIIRYLSQLIDEERKLMNKCMIKRFIYIGNHFINKSKMIMIKKEYGKYANWIDMWIKKDKIRVIDSEFDKAILDIYENSYTWLQINDDFIVKKDAINKVLVKDGYLTIFVGDMCEYIYKKGSREYKTIMEYVKSY